MTAFEQDVYVKAVPRVRFMLATKNTPRRVLHLVGHTRAVWSRRWPRKTLTFDRLEAQATCQRWLNSVTLHREPPTGFELCNYCLAAELGIEVTTTATKALARAGAEVLDLAERRIGAPVARSVRLARIGGVA